MPKTISEQFEEFGVALNSLLLELPDHDAITDTLDYALGALHGLVKAHELGFRDRPTQHFSVYRPHLSQYALLVSKNQPMNELWRAGFYFNSGIQRLAAAFDRIPQMLDATMKKQQNGKQRDTSAKERMKEVNRGGEWARWASVYYEVNAFKHEPEGRAAGRKVTMADAVSAFDQMLALLEKGKPILQRKYHMPSSVAIHEAGHAMLCDALGLAVERVSISLLSLSNRTLDGHVLLVEVAPDLLGIAGALAGAAASIYIEGMTPDWVADEKFSSDDEYIRKQCSKLSTQNSFEENWDIIHGFLHGWVRDWVMANADAIIRFAQCLDNKQILQGIELSDALTTSWAGTKPDALILGSDAARGLPLR